MLSVSSARNINLIPNEEYNELAHKMIALFDEKLKNKSLQCTKAREKM